MSKILIVLSYFLPLEKEVKKHILIQILLKTYLLRKTLLKRINKNFINLYTRRLKSSLLLPNGLAKYTTQAYGTPLYIKDIQKIDRLVSNLIKQTFTVTIMSSNKISYIKPFKLIIGEPIIKHSITKVTIMFDYYDPEKLMSSLSGRNKGKYCIPQLYAYLLALTIPGAGSSLIKVLTKIYEKEVIIIPNKIKYPYNNSTIFAKFIQTSFSRKPSIPNIAFKLSNSVPIINAFHIGRLRALTLFKYNKHLSINLFNSTGVSPDVSVIYKGFNPTLTASQFLSHKYSIGWALEYHGRKDVKSPMLRTESIKFTAGTLKDKNFIYLNLSNRYFVNLLSANQMTSTASQIYPNGVANISIYNAYA